jgi:uncharacterized protein YjbI with pentapeptide repeats
MASKPPKRRTLGASLRTALQEEWGIWLAIAILLLVTFLLSNQLAAWLEKSAFIKVLDSLSKLGVLIAAIAFLREIPKWKERAEEEAKRRRFEYWKAVDSANTVKRSGEGRFFSTALKIALEELAKEKNAEGKSIKLSINADGAKLEDIDLEGAYLYVCGLKGADLSGAILCNTKLEVVDARQARLFGADLRGSQFIKGILLTHALYDEKTQFPVGFDSQAAEAYKIGPDASLQGAMLVNASLWTTNLENANLRGANLKYAVIGGNWRHIKLQDANLEEIKNTGLDLRWANLQGANLNGARIKDIDILGADLRGARNIAVEQIKESRNWEQAIYDNDFRQELGLLP